MIFSFPYETGRRLLALMCASLLLGGCGTVADPTEWFASESPAEKPAELIDLEQQIKPVVIWSRDVGVGAEDLKLGLSPWIGRDTVYVADSEGLVQALDIETGNLVWSVETEIPVAGGPGYGEDLVLLGTSDADVIALDAQSGKEVWRTRVSSEVLSTPVAALGTVIVHTLDGKLFGLNTTDGTERWRYDRTIPVLTLRGSGSPVISGTTVFCGFAGGKLVALDVETGVPQWDISVTVPSGRSELERLSDIDGDPLVHDGTVYAVTYQGEVAAIGEATGNLLWRRKLSSYNGLSADWRKLYLTDDEGLVWALETDNGAARWRQEDLKNRGLSAPVVLGEYLAVGDMEGYLHWFSTDDGRMLGRTSVSSERISAAPRVVNGTLYVLSDDGDLTAIRLPVSTDQ